MFFNVDKVSERRYSKRMKKQTPTKKHNNQYISLAVVARMFLQCERETRLLPATLREKARERVSRGLEIAATPNMVVILRSNAASVLSSDPMEDPYYIYSDELTGSHCECVDFARFDGMIRCKHLQASRATVLMQREQEAECNTLHARTLKLVK